MNQMVEKNSFMIMNDLQGYFRPGEREALYNSADNLRDKALIRLLWVTGRRITEILRIRINEIDFERSNVIIHVEKKTKTLKDQVGNRVKVKKDLMALSHLDSYTLKLLKVYIHDYNLTWEDWLFKSPTNTHKPLTRQRAFDIIRRLGKETGVTHVGNKQIHPHHFRHSYAIDVSKKMKTPADVRKLQMLMNHSTLAVTEQYLQFSDKDVTELIEDLYDANKGKNQ